MLLRAGHPRAARPSAARTIRATALHDRNSNPQAARGHRRQEGSGLSLKPFHASAPTGRRRCGSREILLKDSSAWKSVALKLQDHKNQEPNKSQETAPTRHDGFWTLNRVCWSWYLFVEVPGRGVLEIPRGGAISATMRGFCRRNRVCRSLPGYRNFGVEKNGSGCREVGHESCTCSWAAPAQSVALRVRLTDDCRRGHVRRRARRRARGRSRERDRRHISNASIERPNANARVRVSRVPMRADHVAVGRVAAGKQHGHVRADAIALGCGRCRGTVAAILSSFRSVWITPDSK